MIHTPIIASNGYKEYKWHVGENQERYSPNRGCNGIFFSVCIDICAKLTRESSHLIPASVLPHSRRCGCPRLQDAHLQGKGLRTLSRRAFGRVWVQSIMTKDVTACFHNGTVLLRVWMLSVGQALCCLGRVPTCSKSIAQEKRLHWL